MCGRKGYCSWGVCICLCVCVSIRLSIGRFSRERCMAGVDTKRGYVGSCNRQLAQQESGVEVSKSSMFTEEGGGANYTWCVLANSRESWLLWIPNMDMQVQVQGALVEQQ